MTGIVTRTEYGDTILVSHPFQAAKALVTWATVTYGILLHSIRLLNNGFVKVEIPGLTSITYAPDGSTEV